MWGVRPKTLDLNSLFILVSIASLSSVRSHVVRWSQSHAVLGRSKVCPVFPPLVAIPLYNTHFWNISWTSESLVTFRRLINIHFGIKGKKIWGTRGQLSQDWLCRPGWGSRFQKEDEWPASLSSLRSSSSRSCPQTGGWGGTDHQQRFSSCLECEGNCKEDQKESEETNAPKQIPGDPNPPLSDPTAVKMRRVTSPGSPAAPTPSSPFLQLTVMFQEPRVTL